MINTGLIGVSGKKRHGKDTVAGMIIRIMQEEKGEVYYKRAFGTKVKEVAEVLTGIPVSEWETTEQKEMLLGAEWNMYNQHGLLDRLTRRKFMTKLGSDVITSHFHKNTWVNAIFTDHTPQSKWIVSDVRFKNEAAAIKERNGVLIRVTDPQKLDLSDTHPSEVDLDDYTGFDYRIVNDGTLEELENKVRLVLFQLRLI